MPSQLSYSQYVPQYVGAPVEEFKSLMEYRNQEFDKSIAERDKLEIAIANTPLEERNKILAVEGLADARKKLAEIQKSGRWEQAGLLVREAAKDFATNPLIISAVEDQKIREETWKEIEASKDLNANTKNWLRDEEKKINSLPNRYDENGNIIRYKRPVANKDIDIQSFVENLGKNFAADGSAFLGALGKTGEWERVNNQYITKNTKEVVSEAEMKKAIGNIFQSDRDFQGTIENEYKSNFYKDRNQSEPTYQDFLKLYDEKTLKKLGISAGLLEKLEPTQKEELFKDTFMSSRQNKLMDYVVPKYAYTKNDFTFITDQVAMSVIKARADAGSNEPEKPFKDVTTVDNAFTSKMKPFNTLENLKNNIIETETKYVQTLDLYTRGNESERNIAKVKLNQLSNQLTKLQTFSKEVEEQYGEKYMEQYQTEKNAIIDRFKTDESKNPEVMFNVYSFFGLPNDLENENVVFKRNGKSFYPTKLTSAMGKDRDKQYKKEQEITEEFNKLYGTKFDVRGLKEYTNSILNYKGELKDLEKDAIKNANALMEEINNRPINIPSIVLPEASTSKGREVNAANQADLNFYIASRVGNVSQRVNFNYYKIVDGQPQEVLLEEDLNEQLDYFDKNKQLDDESKRGKVTEVFNTQYDLNNNIKGVGYVAEVPIGSTNKREEIIIVPKDSYQSEYARETEKQLETYDNPGARVIRAQIRMPEATAVLSSITNNLTKSGSFYVGKSKNILMHAEQTKVQVDTAPDGKPIYEYRVKLSASGEASMTKEEQKIAEELIEIMGEEGSPADTFFKAMLDNQN